MIPRALVALLVGGSLTAAAGGAYIAVRQSGADSMPATAGAPPAAPVGVQEAGQPVSETEAVVERPEGGASPPAEAPAAPIIAPSPAQKQVPAARPDPRPRREPARNARRDAPATSVAERDTVSEPVDRAIETVPVAEPASAPLPESRVADEAPAPNEPMFVEVVIPASAVIGLQVETPVSSERNQVEDRVEARVTRDVLAAGRVAIPAGSRVIGAVTMVERGGKMKERARLGVRFHTVVLASGMHVPLRTETIMREGDSPSGESARKIGGAAAGGAILGAILGGGKGAAVGGAAGAGAGTAVVMSGDRNHATLPAGTTVTARLASPVVIELER